MKNISVSVPTMPRVYYIILAMRVFTLSEPILPLRLKKSGISLTHCFFTMLQESPSAQSDCFSQLTKTLAGRVVVWVGSLDAPGINGWVGQVVDRQIKPGPFVLLQQFLSSEQDPISVPQTAALEASGNKKIQSMKMIRSFFCIGNRAN